MNKQQQIQALLDELAALRLEVALQVEAARETQALLLALAGEQKPKLTACDWLRAEGISMFGEVN